MKEISLVIIALIILSCGTTVTAGSHQAHKQENSSPYLRWVEEITKMFWEAGCVGIRIHRNLLGAPQVRISSSWHSIEDWAKFAKSGKWQQALAVLRRNYATNVQIMMWRLPSGPGEAEEKPITGPGEPEAKPIPGPGEPEAKPIPGPGIPRPHEIDVDITFDLLQPPEAPGGP